MSLKTRNTLNLKLNKQDARQGGEGKTKRGKAGETKCRRADWVAWLERVSPSSMMWVRRTHGYQRREAESGSGGAQCSPIQLWVSRKEVGTFTKKNKQKQIKKQGVEGSPLRKARWESGGWTTRMSITTCTKKPHTDPRVLAMASESDTNLMFAAKKTNKTKQNNLDKTRGAGASVSITALHERDDPVHGLVCFWRGEGHPILFSGMWSTKQRLIQSHPEQRQERADTKQMQGHS